jgi:hypothetical protein
MGKIVCAICGQEGKEGETFTIREAWCMAGGFGDIPEHARVHVKCDEKETRLLKQGKIKLEDIYERRTK